MTRELDRWDRLAPLTGLLFVLLVVVGGFLLERTTPSSKATASHVIAFYTAHRERERAGAIVVAFSFVAFLFFAGALRARWRRHHGVEALSALLLAAATLLAAGQTAGAGIVYTLTDAPQKLSESSAQTLNLLQNDFVITSAAGFLAFGLMAGLAILRGRLLPSWLGWSALVIGILFVTPLELVAVVLLLVWTTAASILVARDHG